MTRGYRRAYVARCPKCGATPAAVMVDCPDAADEVAGWMRGGLLIEQVDVDEVRVMFSECRCHEPGQTTLLTEQGGEADD